MKKKFRKIIFIIAIALIIISIASNVLGTTVVNDVEFEETEDQFNLGGAIIDGVVGLLTIVIRIPIVLILMALQALLTGIAALGGTSNLQGLLTPDDIFFNELKITDINFFNLNSGAAAVDTIRANVATWYYVMRILAIVILLAILIYVGIRMAISTVASEKAQYKRMLTDWAVSFALVFLLNYIIMFTLEVNDGLVALLNMPARVKLGEGVSTALITQSIIGVATVSWGSLIVYAMLIGMTTAFLVSYIRRMLTVGFLIIISPLITITYSIDRMGDGRAQALNTWLREFMFNVLIQPFHCIIYLVFISSAMDLLKMTSPSLPKMILAILCMSFVHRAERIIREIFGFNRASSLGETVATLAAVREVGRVVTRTAGAAAPAVSRTAFGRAVANSAPVRNVNRVINRIPQRVRDTVGAGVRNGMAVGMGVAAASFEVGLNSPANAAQVGVQAFEATRARMFGNPSAPGSRQNIQLSETQLKRFADLMAANTTTFNRFNGYSTDPTKRNDLRAYAQSLIGTNMDMLNNDIQDALRDVRNADPTYYDVTTNLGQQHLRELQDLALDQARVGSADPLGLGRTLTAEEQRVVDSIQIRNFAQSVQNLNSQYTAAGYNSPSTELDTYITGM